MSAKDIESRFVKLPIASVEPNEGQLEGLPTNPRKISDSKMELLKENIQNYPEMLEMCGLLVYPLGNGKYIIICGNMRYRAICELGWSEVPCWMLPEDTPVERLRAFAIIDNNGFGKWDWDMIANEWDAQKLSAWGVDLFISENEVNIDEYFDEGDNSKTKNNGGKITVVIPEKHAELKDEIVKVLDEGLRAYEGIIVK